MWIKLLLITIAFSLVSFHSYAAKKACAEFLNKLHNIQSKQRQSHSFKSSVSLREREDKARKKWWACENNKLKPKSKKRKKSKKKKVTTKKLKRTKSASNLIKQSPHVFASNNNIVIKTRFSGDKQLQWLNYYKRPKKCAKPKTTQMFAFCMENKAEQQDKFEKQTQ